MLYGVLAAPQPAVQRLLMKWVVLTGGERLPLAMFWAL